MKQTKTAILFEMSLLWVATMLLWRKRHPEMALADLVVFVGAPSGAAILILMALLTIPVDVSDAEWPALAGALIAGSGILYMGSEAAIGLEQVLRDFKTWTRLGAPVQRKGAKDM